MKTAMQERGDAEIEAREVRDRVEALKRDVTNLEKRKADLLAEAEGIKLNVEADMSRRITENRMETAKISEERKKLEEDKKAFAGTVSEFSQEKKLVEKAKEDAKNTVDGYKKMYEKLSRFIVMVRRESELL